MSLIRRVFRYYDENARPKMELDPMRLVHLADAAWAGETNLPAAQVHLAVNRKKAEVKDRQGQIRKSQAESKDLYQILECITGWHYRAFAGQLNIQSVDGIADKDRNGTRQLPATDLRFKIEDIARDCNIFYKPILESENKLMRERGYIDSAWEQDIHRLLAAARDKMRRGEVFLLRAGRHSGAESVTLNGVRSIKIMKGSGEKPEYLDAAKTIWLAANDKEQAQNLLPFGWLLVELQPLSDLPIDWSELKAICEPRMAAARGFAEKLARQQVRLEQARAEAEAKRRDETERARLAAESETQRRRDEEARQAHLASLSPNMRRIEEFKAAFAARAHELRGKLDRQNTQYHDRAKELAKQPLESPGWTPGEKRAAADAIAEWLPKVVERIDKAQLKKLGLDALRGPG